VIYLRDGEGQRLPGTVPSCPWSRLQPAGRASPSPSRAGPWRDGLARARSGRRALAGRSDGSGRGLKQQAGDAGTHCAPRWLADMVRWRAGRPASAVAAAGRGHFLPPTASRDHLPCFWPWSTGRSGGRDPSGCRPGRSGRPWRSRRQDRQAAQPPGRWSRRWRDLRGDDANSDAW